MKRKITEIEQKLFDNDYRLYGKNYTGKHSEKVESYVYVNGNNAIKLDSTRTKPIDFALVGVNVSTIDKTVLLVLIAEFKALNEFVASLCPQKEEKCLKSPILEEDNEIISNAKGKTFEQLDEENLEKGSE